MTSDAPLPDALRQWLTRQLPGLDTVADVSWSRDCSRVWRVSAGTTEAYLKLSPTAEHYAREVRAHHHAPLFAPHEIPRLLATDPGPLALLTSPVPGLVVRGLSLTGQRETRVHERAGRLLRRWHDLPEPSSDQARETITASITEQVREAITASITEQVREADQCLQRGAEHLTDAQTSLIRRVVLELPQLAETLPVVYRHGDYSPRNWLWDAEHDTVGLIDFEHADPGIAVEDLVWLHGALWPTRPELKAAFLSGYGRPLTEAEQRILPLLTARLAVSYLITGLTRHDPVLIDRGRTALHHLVTTDR
jgi:aminoglycoside/choline kinase family phosphotransferase